ncbi:MAG: hypothetical protein OEL89_05185, partial [Candidatus Peregrinibacteria bacterium]|nr:hypothetical protein [Candidatus Peregrinibacteria bacterium]
MEELQLNKKNIISFYRFLSHESYSHFQVFMVNENGKSSQITSQSSFPSQSYFINDEKILLKGCEKFKDKGIICLGINEREKGHTKIEDGIHKINLILFDIDVIEVVREDGIAPQKYIEKASMIGEEIEKRLNELGFTVDYKAFSGNGLHGGIKVNIELPKFKSKKKWKESEFYQRLVALENEMRAFETNEIKIDTISKDIARRVKIPGTFNIKRYKIGEKQYKLMAPEKWRITRIVYLNENVNEQKNNEAFFNLLLPELLEKKKERDPLDFLDEKETPIELEYFIKKDRKLKRLMEGDSSDYNSRSEAEMGLVIKLVHYGFNTRSSIDPIMNSCNLGKWQEKGEDYKDLTLENATSYHDAHYPAVERLYETYEKVFKRPATRISKGKEYETKDFQSWKTENYEDFDDRELYIQISEKCKHQFNIITLKQSKIMMIGNGYYYTSDITEVIEFVALQLRDENVKNFKTMKANVFELIQDTSSFDEKDFYFEDRFIPFLNGYYDLEKETLHPYEGDIDKPFFYVIPHEYKRGLYDCPKFKKKIKEWVINPNSKINEEDIFESFGYTMTPSTAYKALFINFGPPHTAKSQLLNILNSLVGM